MPLGDTPLCYFAIIANHVVIIKKEEKTEKCW